MRDHDSKDRTSGNKRANMTTSRRADELLSESEERYRTLFENATEGLFLTTPEGRYISVNPSLARIFKYSSPEEMMASITDIGREIYASPDDRRTLLRILAEKGKCEGFEIEMVRKDKTRIWVTMNVHVVRDRNGNILHYEGTCVDIMERKRAEEALRESEERYRTLFENATEGLFLTTPVGRYISVNPSLARMFRYNSPQDMIDSVTDIGKQIYAHEEDRLAFIRIMTEQGKCEGMELEMVRKDGSIIWISMNVHVVRDKQGKVLHYDGTCVEITERRRAQELLRDSEERYRTLFENATEGLFMTTPAGRYLSVNPSVARMFRYDSPQDMIDSVTDIGKQIYAHEADRLSLNRLMQEYGKVEGLEIEMVRKDKTLIWINMNIHVVRDRQGNIIYYDGTCVDITERKRAEELLRESEKKFRTIFDLTPVSVVITDLDGRYVDVNARMCQLCDLVRDDFIGRHPRDDSRFYRSVSLQREEELVQKIRHEGSIVNEEIQFIRPFDGDKITVLFSSRLVSIAGKDCLLSTMLDITERRLLEEQLNQSQKMESVGRLAGGVAHDFNNLLTAILGNTDLVLSMDENLDPHSASCLKVIQQAGQSAAELTRQLLAFSRKQIIEQKVIGLGILVKNMEKMLSRLIGEDIDLRITVRPGEHLVKVDPGQMNQIVLNMAVNARDAMPDGGTVTIEISNICLDESYCQGHGYSKPGDYVLLSITDTGVGMTDEVKERIFEPFFTTKGLGKGTGLGLATVYGAVKQNGGSIEVYSEPGSGACFKIYFPMIPGETEKTTQHLSFEPLPGGTETILIVEDNSMVLKFAREVLEQLGYKILSAQSAEEALDISRRFSGALDLLATDVVLPGKNGRQLADMLKIERPGIKVLFSSGYTEDTIVHRGVLEQNLYFIAKPYNSTDLARKVRMVLDGEG